MNTEQKLYTARNQVPTLGLRALFDLITTLLIDDGKTGQLYLFERLEKLGYSRAELWTILNRLAELGFIRFDPKVMRVGCNTTSTLLAIEIVWIAPPVHRGAPYDQAR